MGLFILLTKNPIISIKVIPTDGYLGFKLTKVVESLVSDGYFFMYSMIKPTNSHIIPK